MKREALLSRAWAKLVVMKHAEVKSRKIQRQRRKTINRQSQKFQADKNSNKKAIRKNAQ